jgi:hypothetical protein
MPAEFRTCRDSRTRSNQVAHAGTVSAAGRPCNNIRLASYRPIISKLIRHNGYPSGSEGIVIRSVCVGTVRTLGRASHPARVMQPGEDADTLAR